MHEKQKPQISADAIVNKLKDDLFTNINTTNKKRSASSTDRKVKFIQDQISPKNTIFSGFCA